MFRVRVLGGFALEAPSGAAAPLLPKRRAEAVLAVLAVCGDLGCTRERLIALLWPECDEAHARHGLRDALHAIRQAFGPRAVRSVGDSLRLDPTVVDSDVLCFRQSLGSGRQADAVRAYTGLLLDGFHVDDAPDFERWLDGERTRLARECAESLEHLATAAERAGAWGDAARWWARAVEHDPLNSHLVLQQVRALAAMGDRANALKVADDHARRLRQELELEPDREVLAHIERIRRGQLPTPRGGAPRLEAAAPAERPQAVEEPLRTLEPGGRPSTSNGSKPAGMPRWVPWAAVVAAVVVLGGGVAAGRLLRTRATEIHRPRTTIAVLPFRNISADTAHAYFAGGLHDELLTQLAKVAALRVIGRTSVSGYQGTSKPLRQIGEELAVGSIVEGSVQVIEGRLRVIVHLLDPITQADLWAERYDRTLDDAFAVQSDIAQRIVATVGATLTGAEAGAIGTAPTQNAAAYQLYLRGLEYTRRPQEARENVEIAQRLYERAVALDSTFALAHAALSQVHGTMYIDLFDASPRRAELQRREAETALQLAPELPQAQVAMGVLHYSHYDYRRALQQFNLALRAAPNDAEVWQWIGFAYRRLGEWDSALATFEHGGLLEPRDVSMILHRGYTLEWVRRYGEAIAVFRHALALAPDLVDAHVEIGWAYMKWKGDWDTLRAVIGGLAVETYADRAVGLHLLLRQPDTVLALLRVMRGPGRPGWGNVPRAMAAAQAYLLRGDSSAARAAMNSGMPFLDSLVRAEPEHWDLHASRGLALARLGRRAEALREARWLEQSELYRRDQYYGPWVAAGHSVILAQLGETDAALAELEQLLARPSHLSVHELRVNALWDPIRHDPRFQALLVKYANPGH